MELKHLFGWRNLLAVIGFITSIVVILTFAGKHMKVQAEEEVPYRLYLPIFIDTSPRAVIFEARQNTHDPDGMFHPHAELNWKPVFMAESYQIYRVPGILKEDQGDIARWELLASVPSSVRTFTLDCLTWPPVVSVQHDNYKIPNPRTARFLSLLQPCSVKP